MKQIHFATTNKGKVNSLSRVLAPWGIEVIHEHMKVPESRTDDLREVATQKALAAFQKIQKPVIVQDAGFYIYSLGGFPKAFVNFALQTIGIGGILKLAEGKPRECEFRNVLAYYDSTQEHPLLFESNIEGTLADSPRGVSSPYVWSQLAVIFIPKGKNKTQAEASEGEYQEWIKEVHQNSYASKFAEWFTQR